MNAEYQDIFNSQDIAVHLEKLSNNNIRWITGDGLCVIYSFKVCMEAETSQLIPPEDIKQKQKKDY